MVYEELDSIRGIKKEKAMELGVLLLLLLPSTVLSAFVVRPSGLGFVTVAVATIFQDIGFLGLILYFLWHDGEPFSSIGLGFRNGWREVALGAFLFVPMLVALTVIENGMQELGFSFPSKTPLFLVPEGAGEYFLALMLLLVIAVCEEVIFRGYMISRFQAITAQRALSIILATIIFSTGHAYEKLGGMIDVGLIGIIFGVVFIWRKSLVAPMVMHFLQDFIGIIIIPLQS